MSGTDNNMYKEYLATRITLFLYNPVMRHHAGMSFKALGFTNVNDETVPSNYFQALSRIIPIIAGESELVLINLPTKPKPSNAQEMIPIYDMIQDTYSDLKSHLAKRSKDPLKLLSKTVPMIEVGDYLREKLIEILYKFRVPAAFFMSVPASTRHLKGPQKQQQLRENFQLHFDELNRYLSQYFRDRDELVALADEKLSEKELSERKKKYEKMMIEAGKYKESGDIDAAITLLRQAIDVFPKDIDAYLESGRLYTRKREYGRALARFSQAEELFWDAPAPNKEIANLRLIQVKEEVEAGADPNSARIMDMLSEAVTNYKDALEKARSVADNLKSDTDLGQPLNVTALGQEILKWDLTEFLGPKHPATAQLLAVAGETTEGLDALPLENISSMQALSLGMQSLEKGDIPSAIKYYFHGLTDREYFSQMCMEINFLGIKLRGMKRYDEAIGVYRRLLKYQPPNQGPVYWNMAVAYAYKKDQMTAAGCAARSLYIDQLLPKEKEFYASLNPQLAATVIRLLKTMRVILVQGKKTPPAPGLVKLYRVSDKLQRAIKDGQHVEALKFFLTLVVQGKTFTYKPEFYGDGVVVKFISDIRPRIEKQPQFKKHLRIIDTWLTRIHEKPVPERMIQYLKLTRAAERAVEERGDQHQAAFYLGQALMLLPETYFTRPDFYAQETLPGLVRELIDKFKAVDFKRFPKSSLPPKPDRSSKTAR
jgi:tetratricopeptide (TPR) repeat protein